MVEDEIYLADCTATVRTDFVGKANFYMDSLVQAWDRAYEADPVSIFGGVIALNRQVDLATAEKMHKIFLEIVIAPGFDDDAFELLAKKKNIRLLSLDFSKKDEPTKHEVVSVMGGMLLQEQDTLKEDYHDWQCVTEKQPTEEQDRKSVV